MLLDVVPATNSVWADISSYLDWRISKNALHVFVHQDRHGIKKKLGITIEKRSCSPKICKINNSDEAGLNNLLILFLTF